MTYRARRGSLRLVRRERGQDLVEFALVLPLLLLLLLGIMEFGIIVFRYNAVAQVAREAARAGVIPCTSEAAIEAVAAGQLSALPVASPVISAVIAPNSDDSCAPGGTVTVSITTDHETLVGTFLGIDATIPLRSSVTMNRE